MTKKGNPSQPTRGQNANEQQPHDARSAARFQESGRSHQRIVGDAYVALCRRLDNEIRGRRSVATHRGGRRPSIAHDIERGLWHDHATGEGGDAVELVRVVLGLSLAASLAWLEREGLRAPSRRLSAAEIAEQRRRREAVERHAIDVADYRRALDAELDAAKIAAIDAGDDTAWTVAADLQWRLGLAPAAVVAEMMRTDGGRVRALIEAGREDRMDAARCTMIAVNLIAGAAVEREQMEAFHYAA